MHDTQHPVGLVSVVVPVLNNGATVGQQLAALARQRTERQFEVLVADNGSSDDTAAVVASFLGVVPGLQLLDASQRRGSNVARNVGTKAARGDIILLCDGDDEVDEEWLDALAGVLDSADAVGGHLDRISLNPEFVARWGVPRGPTAMTVELDYLPRPISANAGYRRKVWEELGGFDETYARSAETEFFWRLQLAGHTLVDVPGAVVRYRMRSDVGALLRQMYIWGRESAKLRRDFASRGMPRNLQAGVRSWLRLGRTAPDVLRGPTARLWWSRQAIYRVGRLVGCVRYRVLYL